MSARAGRPALALMAALLLAGGLAGCGGSHDPTDYQRGYHAGLAAKQRFIDQLGPSTNLPWLCAEAAYKEIQDMRSTAAVFWEDGFNLGCASEST